MNARLAILVFVLAILAVAVALVFVPAAMPAGGGSLSKQITAATSTIMASTSDYTIDAAYPQFGIPAVDSQIKSWVEKGMSDLEVQAAEDQPAKNGFPLYGFTSQFDSVYIDPDLISVRLVLAQYTGGAHELPIILGANFDRLTGVEVTLSQALALTGKSLDQIAQEAKAQLARSPDTAPAGMWASGSDPTPLNYSTFIITKNSVIFIFQPYQVAPYAAGAPEVSIPRIK